MEAFEDLYPGEMSGGMRKRLALLRATVLMPRLLVLDETLVSVEPMLRHKIVDDFSAIWHSLGVGVLLISHDISPEISRHVVGEIRLDRK